MMCSDDVSESIYDNEEERLKHVMGKVADAEARRGEFATTPNKDTDYYERKFQRMLALLKLNLDHDKWDREQQPTQITDYPTIKGKEGK
jgi:hypothetical protein